MDEVIAVDQIKQYFDKVQRLEEEKRNIMEDIKDVYKDAESNGFDPKILRKVHRLAKLDPDKLAEEESLVNLYRDALGV